jgi:AraC-like DNA-binding protein
MTARPSGAGFRVILTQLPDVQPIPRNAEFRRWFYSRWGKENSVVSGSAKRAEYDPYRQTLSVKTVVRGREHYFVEGRRITVTDETYLVLNENRTYSSLLEGQCEAYTFSIFFRPGMGPEIAGESLLDLRDALDREGAPVRAPVEFSENLRRHDKSVSPVLRYIQRHVALGVDSPGWYEEQFAFLLERLLNTERALRRESERIECVGAPRRRELMKRIGWATDFMHSNLQRDLALADIARAARLSQFHFLRVFRQVHGVTPFAYLGAQRTERALALLRTTRLGVNEIAEQVGLSRLALWRRIRASSGAAPQHLRKELKRCSANALASSPSP